MLCQIQIDMEIGPDRGSGLLRGLLEYDEEEDALVVCTICLPEYRSHLYARRDRNYRFRYVLDVTGE